MDTALSVSTFSLLQPLPQRYKPEGFAVLFPPEPSSLPGLRERAWVLPAYTLREMNSPRRCP